MKLAAFGVVVAAIDEGTIEKLGEGKAIEEESR